MAYSPSQQQQQQQQQQQDGNSFVEMISCTDCGHLVPEPNLAIHKARACRGRARPVVAATVSSSPTTSSSPQQQQSVVDLRSPSSTTTPVVTGNRKREDEGHDPTARKRRTGNLKRGDDDEDGSDQDLMDIDDEVEQVSGSNQEVVDLLDDDDGDDDIQVEEPDEWACPRCTLLNPQSIRRCEACHHGRENSTSRTNRSNSTGSEDDDDEDVQVEQVRPADPVRRERLIGGDDDDYDTYYGHGHYGSSSYSAANDSSSPLGMVGGGALLGGVLGAANAYVRGRPMGSSVFEGAMTGGLAGGLANELFRNSPQQQQQQPQRQRRRRRRQRDQAQAQHVVNIPDDNDSPLSQARSAAANGQPAYPVMSDGSNGSAGGRRTRQPRPSFRVVQRSNNNGYTTTIVQSSGRDGATRIVRRSGEPEERDPLLSYMLHSIMAEGGAMPPGFRPMMHGHHHHHQHPNIDGMSYEQLLSAFGDGTENLRASEEIISALPTHKVTLKADGGVDLPKDAQQCSICLEDFEEGQMRKTLPCLHGMHEDCIDKWLRTNAACPVCKYNVKQTGDGNM